ncbi:MAG: biopolymer transporter ExbD [candidate division WOR-3 bacterium]|nr:biopolymer transporter ExbD [candidate division WOR-3 bacterium]
MKKNFANSGLIQDLNFTNLVDVALTILVVFIITAPMMTPGIDVNLPRTDASLPHDEEGITVSIKGNKELFIETDRIKPEDFESRLKKILEKKPPGVMVYLRADKDIDYGFVIEMIGKMRKAGVKDLGLVAEIPQEQ